MRNSRTRSLVLDYTLTEDTASLLLPALKRNAALYHLSLAHCNLTQESVPTIMALLQANPTLLWIDLTGNSIPAESLQEIEGMLAPRRASVAPVPLVWSSSIPRPIPVHGTSLSLRTLSLSLSLSRSPIYHVPQKMEVLDCASSPWTALACVVSLNCESWQLWKSIVDGLCGSSSIWLLLSVSAVSLR